MKTTVFILFVLALGVAAGIGIATLRVGDRSWTPPAQVDELIPPAELPAAAHVPASKLVVDPTSFDFGTVYGMAEGSHDFVFTNVGGGPLHLVLDDVSSPSVTAKLEKADVPPRQSAKVTLAWKCSDVSNLFQQTVKMLTNDPARGEVTLMVSGRINAAVQASPIALLFPKLSPDKPASAAAHLFCYVDQPLKILGHTMSDSAIAQYFNVSLEPMSGDEVKKQAAAKSGVLVTVALKPGLPPGLFKQEVVLKTNLKALSEFTLPVLGVVESDIVIAGRGWDPATQTLTLGNVSGKTGFQTRLSLMVHGQHRKQVKFKPTAVTPKLMKVSLGQPTELNNGATVQTPLLIEIPPGSPSANYLGWNQSPLGEIILETTHPQIPKVRLSLRMAVEN
jgi:hypothetical protein